MLKISVKWRVTLALLSFSTPALLAHAQSPKNDPELAQETQVRGYWTDPSTGLMWAGKDNGRDTNWHTAMNYCHNLRLAGYSDWRLPAIDKLQGIYDKNAEAPGLAGKHGDERFTWHVKGSLFLTGLQWSSTHVIDREGNVSGLAWYFDFINGRRNDDDAGRFTGRFADNF